jgi:hypothetical protein
VRNEVELTVSAEELANAVLDEEGELSPKACVDLCIEKFCGTIEEVHGCDLLQPATTAGDTDAAEGGTIACDVTAVPCCE